ncbi:MAG: DegT/DnrJ/EryC1/StrS aminotransferase family protein [Candidatus Rokubacteria bacterium]|nr:DegT/DnrJ/EryC1/StrS aminotransferase family protein [Candidatus Rokubacteria bacterium]
MSDRAHRIPLAQPELGEEELANVVDAVRSGWISSLGAYIGRFEEGFAAHCTVRHGVAVMNGTAALHLSLAAAGVGPGDEVIVPTLTFVATPNAVRYCGATPVFVDADPAHWSMDARQVEARVTPRTRAIVPVHLYGHPCDMDPIMDVARRHRLTVVEDAAEAIGGEYRGRRVGSLGHVASFSFYGNKTMTTGEGGMCVTDDAALRDQLVLLRDHGMDAKRRYWHEVIGFNYRMTNLQAAVGVAQLGKLERFVATRREVASWYAEALADLARRRDVTLQPELPWAKSAFWLSCILLPPGGPRAHEMTARLAAEGVDSRPFFHPMHTLPPYRTAERFPVAEDLAARGLNLPSGYGLTRADVDRVASALARALDFKS